jgi:hypothetical protein
LKVSANNWENIDSENIFENEKIKDFNMSNSLFLPANTLGCSILQDGFREIRGGGNKSIRHNSLPIEMIKKMFSEL